MQAFLDAYPEGFSGDVEFRWEWDVEEVVLSEVVASKDVTRQQLQITSLGFIDRKRFRVTVTMTNTTSGGSAKAHRVIEFNSPPYCTSGPGCLQVS